MLQAQLKSSQNALLINNVVGNNSSGIHSFSTNSVMFVYPMKFIQFDKSWILDSGATHHITLYFHLINNAKIINSECHSPYGDLCTLSQIVEVHISTDIALDEMLVEPTFQCNLLSIVKLLDNTSYTVSFSSTKCLLQDSVMKKEI